jgi:hypothetical protein
MTTITYRDGILAADSGTWQGIFKSNYTPKIHKINDHLYFASCGFIGFAQKLKMLLEERNEIDIDYIFPKGTKGNGGAIVIDDSRNEIMLLSYKCWEKVNPDRLLSIGSGGIFAMACMVCGKTAIEAIELAIIHTTEAIGPVKHFETRLR